MWLPESASPLSQSVDPIFNFILWMSIILFVGIILVVIYFSFKYRKDNEVKRNASFTHHTMLEITWSVIPLILVMFIFAWGAKGFMNFMVSPAGAQEIRVTGKQWLWQFDYPKEGITSMGEFVVPVNKPIKLIMSSEDVLHSFFIPNMRIKYDLVPNRYTTTWFEADRIGVYQVFCTEYCGDAHSNMLAVLKVVSEEDYEEWLATSSDTSSIPLMELGEKLYVKSACNTCHALDDSIKTGPSWKNLYGMKREFEDGSSLMADDNYLRESIMDPKCKIVKGFQPVMPTYQGLLKDREVDALIEFIKAQTSE